MTMPRTKWISLAGAVVLLSSALAGAASLKVVRTESGPIAGVPTADGKVIAYKGVPYAASPVGELRWKPPQPAPRWKKAILAADFGSHCIQFATYNDMVFHDSGPSEDCLTLNVWAPADAKPMKKAGGLPVMIWIYGGGFVTGGTSERRQDGQFLAHRGVIVVSMNYRLGIFGFMTHPELTAESAHHASGNYGLMDQAAAIAWVGRNIAAFGGDPSKITIFGESAGSMSVSAQMASPVVKGLFARAIGESGGGFYSGGLGIRAREVTEPETTAWATRVFGTDKLFYLRNLTTDELLKAAMAKGPSGAPGFRPVIDGYFLPQSLPTIFSAGEQSQVPLLAGWNSNESRAQGKPTIASFTEQARREFGGDADAFLAVYPATSEAQAVNSANDYAGDKFIAFSTWAWIEAAARSSKAPVYRYFFDLGSPGDKNHSVSMGAFHSDDIEYVFGALSTRPEMAIRPEDQQLSELMQQYWVNFARTGDPNGAGVPKWPVYNGDSGWQVMHLDATPAASPDALRGRYLFLDSEWGRAAGK